MTIIVTAHSTANASQGELGVRMAGELAALVLGRVPDLYSGMTCSLISFCYLVSFCYLGHDV
jgi:hypothetical protein